MKTLRPYQKEAVEKIDQALNNGHKSTIMALPTGSGKTFTAVSWMAPHVRAGKRVLWWVHRIELLRQAQEELRSQLPSVRVTEWTADSKDATGQIVLAMILSSRALEGHWDYVVIDECHHAAMPTYVRKLEEIDHDRRLGLSATPTRADRQGLNFDSIAIQKTVLDLVEEGYLAQPVYVKIRTGQRARMRIQAGDFSARSLRQLDNLRRNQMVAKAWADDWERWGKTLIFACNIEHAENIQRAINHEIEERGLVVVRRPDVVHSRIPMGSRERRTRRFQSWPNSVMINVGVFTEGFDAPDVKTIMMARPTASESLYLQMIGRGTRLTEGKDHFYVVDFVDQLGKYSLLAAQWARDNLGFEDPEEIERERQEAIMAQGRHIMEEARLPNNDILQVMKEFTLFAGIIEYKTSFSTRPHKAAMSEDLYVAWQKLQLLLENVGQNAKEVITSSFALTGASSCNFPFREWKELAWATFFMSKRLLHKGYVKFTGFKPISLERDALVTEMDVARADNLELNQRYASEEAQKELMAEINMFVENRDEVPDFCCKATYQDQVLTVDSNYVRDRLRPRHRAEIRETIVEQMSALLDIDLNLVLHWL